MCALFGLGLWPFRGLQHITVSKCLPICVIEDDPKNWKFVNILICDGTMKSSNSRPLFVDFLRKEFFKRILHATICLFLSLQKSFLFCQKVNNSPNCRSNYTWHSPAVVEPKILRHFSWKHFANGQLGQWQSQLNFEQAFTLTVLSRLVILILLNYRPIISAPKRPFGQGHFSG